VDQRMPSRSRCIDQPPSWVRIASGCTSVKNRPPEPWSTPSEGPPSTCGTSSPSAACRRAAAGIGSSMPTSVHSRPHPIEDRTSSSPPAPCPADPTPALASPTSGATTPVGLRVEGPRPVRLGTNGLGSDGSLHSRRPRIGPQHPVH
jgi:hypothetical protein